MNIRFDPASIRVRITHAEGLQLQQTKRIAEVYPFGGLTLDVEAAVGFTLSMELSNSKNYLLKVPMDALENLLKNIGQAHSKKEELSIRDSIVGSHSRVDLIFEIDCFKPDRRKST